MNNIKIDKKTILLFGANGGIGNAIKNTLNESGNIDLIKFNREELDLGDLDNLETNFLKLISAIEKNQSKIDSIIYTSGIILDSQTETNPSAADIKNIFAVNTFAPIMIHNLIQDKLSINSKFIYLSSTATLGPNGLFPIYTTSKKAAETFFKIQSDKIKRKENNLEKIIIILPGPTNTPMREKIAKDSQTQQSPDVLAQVVKEIILEDKYENGDSIVAKNNIITVHKN